MYDSTGNNVTGENATAQISVSFEAYPGLNGGEIQGNASVIAHNLKSGGFRVAWELMQPGSVYDHRRCRQDWPNSPAFGAGGSRRPWFNRGRGRGRKLAIL